MRSCRYLIVGGGATADAAVKGIREADGEGGILVACDEPSPPYRRPPLSKDLWTGGRRVEDILYATAARGAEILVSTRIVSIHPSEREARDAQGETYRYEKLLLATGAVPRRLPYGGANPIYYRTKEDYLRLRGLVETGRRFCVIGGGFVGSEIAAALNTIGREITMIFPEQAVQGQLLPRELAQSVNRYYESRGVRVLADSVPCGIEARGAEYVVRTVDGPVLDADGVVAGVGIEANVSLAADAGLENAGGIVVDRHLRTGDPNVYAAGDAAVFHNASLGMWIRFQHEDNALSMGYAAGVNMAGANQPYHHLPHFYSSLFDLSFQGVGEFHAGSLTYTRVRSAVDRGVIFHLRGERVCGVIFWNVKGKLDAGRELLASAGPHTEESLDAWSRERLNA